MCYDSRRPHHVPLPSAKSRNLRLQRLTETWQWKIRGVPQSSNQHCVGVIGLAYGPSHGGLLCWDFFQLIAQSLQHWATTSHGLLPEFLSVNNCIIFDDPEPVVHRAMRRNEIRFNWKSKCSDDAHHSINTMTECDLGTCTRSRSIITSMILQSLEAVDSCYSAYNRVLSHWFFFYLNNHSSAYLYMNGFS